MTTIITHDNLLIKYLYNETDIAENHDFSVLLNTNAQLYETYINALFVKNTIDNLRLLPSVAVENNILEYC